jgi:hypothetical protein
MASSSQGVSLSGSSYIITLTLNSAPELFDLRSNGRIGGLKRRLRPRGAASGDAKEREQDEENANCSPIVGHRSPIRVSQLAARKPLCNHFNENQSAVANLKMMSL